ncbi:DUF2238 domain-containing protein [Enterobacter cloacae]|uniref:DUF2238 domain-containing protein n=1 Tax=Enterobacter cloacae TaxID=550 RepID=UPI003D6AD8E5
MAGFLLFCIRYALNFPFCQVIVIFPDNENDMTLSALKVGSLLPMILFYTGLFTSDRVTTADEVTPVIIIPLLLATHRRPLTPFSIPRFLPRHHSTLVVCTPMQGSGWFEVQEMLGLSRNPYDKLGHFFQGLVPACSARNSAARWVCSWTRHGFLVCCVALAISATYELIEWWAALAMGQGADDFLGTQGDPWDTRLICFARCLCVNDGADPWAFPSAAIASFCLSG